MSSLLQKYVRREYFTNTMMCFSKKYMLHNSFLMILLNNIEMLMNYLKTLKGNLFQEYNEIFSEEKHPMIFSSIEELEVSNRKRFELLLKEKMKIIVEFLKLTVFESLFLFIMIVYIRWKTKSKLSKTLIFKLTRRLWMNMRKKGLFHRSIDQNY